MYTIFEGNLKMCTQKIKRDVDVRHFICEQRAKNKKNLKIEEIANLGVFEWQRC